MASGPITSWQIDEETMETVTDFFWGVGSKITADDYSSWLTAGDYNHEMKKMFASWKKRKLWLT